MLGIHQKEYFVFMLGRRWGELGKHILKFKRLTKNISSDDRWIEYIKDVKICKNNSA